LPIIRVETRIKAPIRRCFDLMRDVTVHTQSTESTGERAVAGVTAGLLEQGDWVTWEAVHLGLRQRLTVRVSRCEPPGFFEDVMVKGIFKAFTHRHMFREEGDETIMTDEFDYTSPLGSLGRLVDRVYLRRYVTRFLENRGRYLKQVAERGNDGSVGQVYGHD
jgi:ligand-binding SRPBCC domain-containing protein